MTRSAREYREEADRLRRRGWTYRQIALDWSQRLGFNPRVAFRLAHGWTQAQVADRWNELWPNADSPKSSKHVSYWEIWPAAGGRAPSLETLNRLAFVYHCNAGDLLGGDDYSHLDTAVEGSADGQDELSPTEVGSSAKASSARTDRAEVLRVAIAIIVDGPKVLLVRPRDTTNMIDWQFPAGVVKPGDDPATVAVSETLAETGVHCNVSGSLGVRLHPLTGVYCEYFLCEYLTGEVENKDAVENLAATWVARDRIGKFIPSQDIFRPVLAVLESNVSAPDEPDRPSIVAAIITANDAVLLVKRRAKEGKLSWQFPAGEAVVDESPQDTAVRESHEEVDLVVTPSHVIGQRTHPATERHMVYVGCEVSEGEARIADMDELDDLAWCSLEQLDDYIPHGVFQPVMEYLRVTLNA